MPVTTGKLVAAALLIAGVLVTGAGLAGYDDAAEPPANSPEAAAAVRLQPPREEIQADQKADSLAGSWQMTLPAGFQYLVTVRPLGGARFSVEKAVRFSGVYELRDKRFILVEPLDRGVLGFEWEVRGFDELVLVAQPPVAKTGANYLGATLRRQPVNNDLPPMQLNDPDRSKR